MMTAKGKILFGPLIPDEALPYLSDLMEEPVETLINIGCGLTVRLIADPFMPYGWVKFGDDWWEIDG